MQNFPTPGPSPGILRKNPPFSGDLDTWSPSPSPGMHARTPVGDWILAPGLSSLGLISPNKHAHSRGYKNLTHHSLY